VHFDARDNFCCEVNAEEEQRHGGTHSGGKSSDKI
jgi:hypothetical protein